MKHTDGKKWKQETMGLRFTFAQCDPKPARKSENKGDGAFRLEVYSS